MRPFALLLSLALVAGAQGNDPHAQPEGGGGVEVTVGWDGAHPVGWEAWTVEYRAEHEARMQQSRVEFGVWFDAHRVEHPDTEWNADLAFGLYTRSVNAGFSFNVSLDLVKTVVVEKVKVVEAEPMLKTVVVEAVAAEKDDDDPADNEEEYRNLGQWVKEQVHSGVHGQDLAISIHIKIKERHEAKMAEKAAKKAAKEHGKSDEDHGKGKPDDKGKGHGKGKDK